MFVGSRQAPDKYKLPKRGGVRRDFGPGNGGKICLSGARSGICQCSGAGRGSVSFGGRFTRCSKPGREGARVVPSHKSLRGFARAMSNAWKWQNAHALWRAFFVEKSGIVGKAYLVKSGKLAFVRKEEMRRRANRAHDFLRLARWRTAACGFRNCAAAAAF